MKKSKDPREAKKPERPVRDSVVDEVRHYMSGRDLSYIYYNCFVSRTTLRNIKSGKTNFPRNSTVDTTLAAMGMERVIRMRRK